MTNRVKIYSAIEEEIIREQMGKSFNHSDGIWLSILIDYLGRATRRIYSGQGVDKRMLIKVLAVGVAWLSSPKPVYPPRPSKPKQGRA